MSVRILFTHRYFWPDSPPYASMLRNLARAISLGGHDVHVYTSQPSYRGLSQDPPLRREMENGVSIRRGFVIGSERSGFIVRAVNSLVYCSGLFVHIIKIRPDVVTAATFPPVIASWTASIAAKLVGAKFIYHMQDIHPEVSRHSGGAMGKGLFFALMRWMDNQTLKRSSVVIVLSGDMANTLTKRNIDIEQLRIINNPPVEQNLQSENPPSEFCKTENKKRLIFAGNLGRFQNLQLLTSGISDCLSEHPELELVFLGDGAVKPTLMEQWGSHPQIKFYPFLPYSQAQTLIRGADVGVVSLGDGICQVSFPSKVSTYLHLGLPLFAFIEPDSELGKIVVENGLGVVPDSMTREAISKSVCQILRSEKPLSDKATNWLQNNWSHDANVSKWLNVFADLESTAMLVDREANDSSS